MKKRIRKNKEQIEHRGNNSDLFRQYQERMKVVKKAHRSFYTQEGEVKHTSSRRDY